MDYRDISPDFTQDGKLRLLAPELDTLEELVQAGDRGAFHFLYGEMADNSDSRLTAKISTFSDTVGGTAFAANWALQQTEPGYVGIYRISQQIAADIMDLVRADAENADGGTGYLTKTEHFESAEDTWQRFGLSDLFPGNLINLIRNESDLGFWAELGDIAAFLTGGASAGERAGLWGAMYSGYTGKKLSDFQGVAGYTILDVAGGKVVIDSDGRTTATFIDAGADDLMAEAARGFTLGSAFETFIEYPETIYNLMGGVGSQTQIQSPFLQEYADARRDFTQFSDGAYNGDNNPGSYPAVGTPTLSITQSATGGRDLLMFTDASEDAGAGAGDDVMMMANGNDRAFGGDGNDIIWGQQGSDRLDGGAGDDILRGGIDSDVLYGGAGDDVLDGSDITVEGFEQPLRDYLFGDDRLAAIDGHDILMGGTGNDLLRGGLGADFLFDRGLETYAGDQIDINPDNAEVYGYDGGDDGAGGVLGSDTLVGGGGSDFMVYSGGRDTFYGGTGDDTYLVSPEFLGNRQFGLDELTIVLEEDAADDTTWFGHDYVIGDGNGIHEIVFKGLNRDDVTFTYEYEETPFDELSVEVQTMFINLLGVQSLDLGTYPIFSLNGRLSITVNATGSSVYFDNVSGAYVGGSNSFGGNIYVQPLLLTQTYAVFEDATYFDWARQLDLIDLIKPVNGTIADEADDAPVSQADERGAEPPEEDPEEQFGTSITDFLVGSSADDNLNGLQGNDYLHGEDGDDLLTGGDGSDLLHGGDGFDTANYVGSTAAISVSLSSGNGSSGEAAGDRLISIEAVRGSAFDDTINGDSNELGNILWGMDGDDRLVTGFGGGDTILYGGNGDDSLIVRSGNARLEGGAGSDQLFSGSGAGIELMFGDAGDDFLHASQGDDLYDGGEGYDTLVTENLLSTLAARYVHLGDGIMRARFFEDTSIGIGTNALVSIEAYRGGTGDDQVFGTGFANLLSGGRGDDELNGLAGNDTLYGGWNDDILRGGDGDDALYGDIDPSLSNFTGSDLIFGGAGVDTAYYAAARASYGFSTLNGVLYVDHGDGNVDQIAGDVEFVAFSDGTYTWNELANIMVNSVPTAADDAVSVTEGESAVIDPRLNDNDPDGDPLTIVEINGSAFGPNSTAYSGPGLDLSVRMTADGGLSFTADDPFGSDLAPGEVFVTTVTYTVSDNLGGFVSADITVTVTGKDEGSDGIVSGTAGDDTINAAYTDADGDTISDTGQTIEGLAGDDRIFDGAGDDTVSGGDGRDRFFAGGGADAYDGGADTRDEVFYTRSTSGLTIDLSNPLNNSGIAAGDTYNSIERLQGSNHNDVIVSGGTVTILRGRAGDDDFTDDAGTDNFRGDAGSDTFRFIAGDGSRDRIFDFEIGADRIDLSAWGVIDFADLSIYEATNGSGVPLGRLIVQFGPESLQLNGLASADIAGLDASHFILAPYSGDGILDGTAGDDIINRSFRDADGDYVNDRGQLIRGGNGDDRIYDGDGDDTVEGGDGRDRFHGGDGADSYDGGADTRDEVIYNLSSVGLTVDASDTANNTGIAAGDTYTNVERLQGSNHDDTLVSGGSIRLLNGRAGNDQFTDDAGRDFFRGGAGADTFRFVADDNRQDVIFDFELNVDVIDLRAWGATGVSDLSITERVDGAGTPLGGLIIDFGSESLRVDGFTLADVPSFDDNQFIFA